MMIRASPFTERFKLYRFVEEDGEWNQEDGDFCSNSSGSEDSSTVLLRSILYVIICNLITAVINSRPHRVFFEEATYLCNTQQTK